MTITLLHGTFSSPKVLSQLAKGLRERFPEAVVDCFPWSGLNSNRQRLQAAQSVAKSLIGRPGPHFFVGHSHGGSIALQASRAVPPSEVGGVVTLNTPFISVHARRPMFQVLVPIAIGAWIHFAGSWLFGDLPQPVANVLMRLSDYQYVFAGVFVFVAFLASRLWSRGKKQAWALYDRMDGRHAAQVPILVIRRPGDEASALLGGVYTLDWILHRVVQVLLWIPAIVYLSVFVALSGLLAADRVFVEINPDTNPLFQVITFFEEKAPMSTLTALAVIFFVCAALTQGLAFGPEYAWLHPWIYCSVDSVPTGRHEALIIHSQEHDRTAGLFHSGIYDDPRVLEAVSSCIAEIRKARSRAPRRRRPWTAPTPAAD